MVIHALDNAIHQDVRRARGKLERIAGPEHEIGHSPNAQRASVHRKDLGGSAGDSSERGLPGQTVGDREAKLTSDMIHRTAAIQLNAYVEDQKELGRFPRPLNNRLDDVMAWMEREEVVEELLWTIDRAEEHLGTERATRYLRKFYPWYSERLGAPPSLVDELHRRADLDRARILVQSLATPGGLPRAA